MRRSIILVAGLLVAGCGGGDAGGSAGGTASGADLVRQNGCLACHRLGSEGKKGPGKALTRAGARLSAAKIRKSLVEPPDGMPAYNSLPGEDLDALVTYLAGRR